jgi:hypothetical protein
LPSPHNKMARLSVTTGLSSRLHGVRKETSGLVSRTTTALGRGDKLHRIYTKSDAFPHQRCYAVWKILRYKT